MFASACVMDRTRRSIFQFKALVTPIHADIAGPATNKKAALKAVSSSFGNSEFVNAPAGCEQFSHPARCTASTGPGLGGFVGILKFRMNLRVGTALLFYL